MEISLHSHTDIFHIYLKSRCWNTVVSEVVRRQGSRNTMPIMWKPLFQDNFQMESICKKATRIPRSSGSHPSPTAPTWQRLGKVRLMAWFLFIDERRHHIHCHGRLFTPFVVKRKITVKMPILCFPFYGISFFCGFRHSLRQPKVLPSPDAFTLHLVLSLNGIPLQLLRALCANNATFMCCFSQQHI